MIEGSDGAVSAMMPGHLIRRLHQISTQIFARRIREAGSDLTPVQFAALDAINQQPGVDQASLAHSIAKDRATVGAVVDRMEQKGLLTRVVSDQDKRARELTLTDKGRRALAALMPVVADLQKEILGGLSEDEYRQFIALAAKAARSGEPANEN
ncbi:MarR family transcriptional regulator [Rhizobium cremeum]|uniref:MarR family winged helix-turn-helix transcriptional regulator n=1 Tax=Rhizobium cremeum TaxID=2813827 RepID=UPI001FD4A603|nr:MarR family transcriptional regulator [Rhizobium cremeum]MCJ7993782.1 MarR family transcriptional regulator [Rhizobium cremeum]MCJ7998839.1 MarR family transcriptional regulator [Rhizobium cremeum]